MIKEVLFSAKQFEAKLALLIFIEVNVNCGVKHELCMATISGEIILTIKVDHRNKCFDNCPSF